MANSVYDPEKQQDNNSSEPRTLHKNPVKPSADASPKEDLRNAESSGGGTEGGGSFNFNPKGDQADKGSLSPAALSNRESGGGTDSGGSFNFNPGKTGKTGSSGFKNFFLGTKKRRGITIGGGILSATLVGGGILTLFLVAGPAQIIQLDETLQRNFSGTNQASSNRLGKLITNVQAQNIGETRLSVIGRQYFRGFQSALSEHGIDFKPNAYGQFGGKDAATLDTEKLKHSSPELESMSPDQREAWLDDQFNIPPDSLTYEGNGVFSVDASSWKGTQVSDFLGSVTGSFFQDGVLGNGRISNALANRFFTQYFDNPSIFHVFEYAKSSAIRQLLNKPGAEEAEKQEQEAEEKTQIDQVGEPAAGDVSDLKDQAGSLNDFATSALTYTAGACFMKNTAGDIITINRYRVVLPAAVTALRFIAIGEQIKSGQDISAEQIGAAEQSLYNGQGQGVWQGRALQATSGDDNPSGPDIPTEYQQAFDTNTTAASISEVANKTLGGAAAASFLCGPIGSIAQGAVSIVQIVGSGALEVFSDGTATPEVAVSLSSKFAAVGASIGVDLAKMATQVKALGFAQNFVVNKNSTGSLAEDAFSGPLGGNLLAYGAREAANMGAIASGGIALTGSNASTYAAVEQQQEEQQFRSESFFARVFDVNDSHSLAGHLADSVNPNATSNVSSIAGGFSNLGGSLLSNLSSLFLPKSQADSSYDWTFPQYGIPQGMLADSSLADPYTNADTVGKVLDSQCTNNGSVNSGCYYISHAKTCFGADINKGSDGWDVTASGNYQPGNDIDPNSSSYISGNCSDLSYPHWEQLIMFIFDMRTAQAAACYSGDDQSCTDLGYDQSSAPSSPTPTTPSGNFTNPFPDGWTPGRLDMGYDGAFKNKIVSPCDGKVIYYVNSQGPNSFEGDYVVVQCSSTIPGLPSNAFYFAEGITATVKQGPVTAGQQIAVPGPTGFSEGPGGIEWGLADPNNPGNALAESGVNGMTDCSAASKAMVLSFSQWVVQNLGVAGYDTSLTDNQPGCA